MGVRTLVTALLAVNAVAWSGAAGWLSAESHGSGRAVPPMAASEQGAGSRGGLRLSPANFVIPGEFFPRTQLIAL